MLSNHLLLTLPKGSSAFKAVAALVNPDLTGAQTIPMCSDSNGNVYFAVTYQTSKVLIVKLDSSNNLVWELTYSFSAQTYPLKIATNGNQVVVVGSLYTTPTKALFVSCTSSGSNVFSKTDTSSADYTLSAVAIDSTSIWTGDTIGIVSKYDLAGSFIASRKYATSYGSLNIYDIAIDSSGNGYICGSEAVANSGLYGFVRKLDSSLTDLGSCVLAVSPIHYAACALDPAGRYLYAVVSSTTTQAYALKLDTASVSPAAISIVTNNTASSLDPMSVAVDATQVYWGFFTALIAQPTTLGGIIVISDLNLSVINNSYYILYPDGSSTTYSNSTQVGGIFAGTDFVSMSILNTSRNTAGIIKLPKDGSFNGSIKGYIPSSVSTITVSSFVGSFSDGAGLATTSIASSAAFSATQVNVSTPMSVISGLGVTLLQ